MLRKKYNVKAFLSKNVKDYKLASSNKEATLNCIFCYPKDYKRKLYVNLTTGVFHCFKCGAKGTFFDFVNEVNKLKFKRLDAAAFQVGEEQKLKDIDPQFTCDYPEGFYFLDDKIGKVGRQAKEYLLNRGLTEEDIYYYKLGFCIDGPFRNRVIIPVFENNKLVSYTGRDFTDKQKPKVLSPPGNGTAGIKRFVFNLDRAKKTQQLYIGEGPFDAIGLGVSGICLFGKQATKEQINKIINTKVKKIVVCLDPDARREAEALALSLSFYYTDVRLAEFPEGEDPGSLDKVKLNLCIQQARKVEEMEL